jgi:hypothetical protein
MSLMLRGALAIALVTFTTQAEAQKRFRKVPPQEETIEEIELQETSPFKDAFHLRLNAGAAYARAFTRYEPSDGSGSRESVDAWSPALALEAGVGLRLGRDVSIGILGGAIHGPVTHVEGSWDESYQGAYYGMLFIDHHFPHQRVVHLGAAVGPGFVHSVGPDGEGFGGWGPVGQAFFGFDLRMSKTVRFGILGTLTGASIRETHAVGARDFDFDTFFFALGAAFTVRVADFKFPTSMPTLAGGCTYGRRSCSSTQ